MLLLLLFAVIPFVAAASNGVLFTSSVTYCEPPETLLIQQFDLTYFAQNQSIFFDIAAASVQKNLNVSANIVLNAYGMTLVNITVDLCSILGGALCPLPTYQFNGSETISLPASLGVSKRIPEIAFRIPDFEAYAQLTLTEATTNDVKACVQATLSNGWSTRQPAVEWAIGILILLLLLAGLWQTLRSSLHPLLAHRLVDLFHLFQFIATTGLFSLNYSLLYRAFTLNFAWTLGLVSSSAIQAAIDSMRSRTGGTMPNSSSTSAVGLVDRKLSPWNTNLAVPSAAQSMLLADTDYTPTGYTPTNLSRIALTQVQRLDSTSAQVQTVTTSSSNVLQAGIPIYVNSIHIGSANAFDTVFIVALVILAITITLSLILYGLLLLADRLDWGSDTQRRRYRNMFPGFIKSWVLRLALIAWPPILLFAIYQWTLKDSWLSTLFSVITFLAVSALIIWPTFQMVRLVRQHSTGIFDVPDSGHYEPLYGRFRAPRYFFYIVFLAAIFLRAVVVAAGQGHGLTQIILCLIIELAIVLAHIFLKPFKTRRGDVFSAYFSIVRLVCTGLMIAFVESLTVAAIPRVAIGAVIAVILSIAVIVLVCNIVFSLVRWPWQRRARQATLTETSTLEKGQSPPRSIHDRPSSPSSASTPTARLSSSTANLTHQ
ncbi:TRP-N domain-containing protein [Mycena indigotica]|uniref:TRP-N domain-containing protein n=1 Tax=Mycena indigotica TaxID=2126181 RepID=A0A8H6TDL6_9AGAR|nr:TRP-N domain-containing protein [Mycena indigotica]KAF7315349.1 TRP-N domain-containing protein [Mycena indigotica]